LCNEEDTGDQKGFVIYQMVAKSNQYAKVIKVSLPSDIQAILFDLDGTLIEIPTLWKFFDDILIQTLNDFNIPIPEKTPRLAVWHSGGAFERIIRSWGIKDYNAFIHTFDMRDLEKRQALIQAGEIRPYSDVTVLAELKKKVKLGIVTNTPPDIALLEIQSFDLAQYFEDLVMLGTVEQDIAKPEPDGILRCLNNLGVKPGHAIMVGDSSSDIIGGQRAGVGTVLIRRPNQPAPQDLEKPPNLVTDSLNSLLDVID
jgi:HAD superfamily hydrolase (TIGR01549 family)